MVGTSSSQSAQRKTALIPIDYDKLDTMKSGATRATAASTNKVDSWATCIYVPNHMSLEGFHFIYLSLVPLSSAQRDTKH